MLGEGLASHKRGGVMLGEGLASHGELGEGLASPGEMGSCWVRDWLHTERWGHVG